MSETRDDERESLINDLNATVSWLKQTGDLLDADRVMRAIAALRKHPEPEITKETQRRLNEIVGRINAADDGATPPTLREIYLIATGREDEL